MSYVDELKFLIEKNCVDTPYKHTEWHAILELASKVQAIEEFKQLTEHCKDGLTCPLKVKPMSEEEARELVDNFHHSMNCGSTQGFVNYRQRLIAALTGKEKV